jgi:hypothetical protein
MPETSENLQPALLALQFVMGQSLNINSPRGRSRSSSTLLLQFLAHVRFSVASARQTTYLYTSSLTSSSSHFHILIMLLLRTARRDGKALHGEFCRVLIDHQFDVAILGAVGAESCKCIAKRGLEL